MRLPERVPTYRLAGVNVVTDLALPELQPGDDSGTTWFFHGVDEERSVDGVVLKEEAIEGRVWMRIVRVDQGFMIDFPDVADFMVSPSERTVTFRAEHGVGDSTLRHLLLDLVFPCLLALDGSLVLHASAVATDRGAVVFAGPSGSGKSSLAAEFTKGGSAVMADDFVLFREWKDGFAVVPAYPGLRLWPDSVEALTSPGSSTTPLYEGGGKQRVVSNSDGAPSESEPLAALIVLDCEADAAVDYAIEPVPAREAMMMIFGQVFRMERSGGQRAVDEFDQLAQLVTSVPVLRLRFRRDYTALPDLRRRILELLYS